MNISSIRPALLLFSAVITAGCASATQPTPAQPIPDGIYRSPSGQVELSLVKGHWFINHGPFKHVEEGSYVLSDKQIKFSLEKAASVDECNPSEKTFTYQWSFDGKSLTLAKLDDNCGIRASDLSSAHLAYGGAAQ